MATLRLALALTLVALVPRLYALNQFSTWDELFWTHASLRFWRALQSENWPRTYIIGQPGVISMWLGSAAVTVKGWQGGEEVWEASRAAGRPRYAADDLSMLGTVADEWRSMTLMTALFTSIAVGGVFLLTQRLVGTRAGLVGAVLLIFDPFYLAHSRVMALDAVLASLMLLGLLSFMVYLLADGRWVFLVLSGILGGLAALQKTTGLFLLGYIGLLSLLPAWALLRRRQFRAVTRVTIIPVLTWVLVACATYVVVWPAMWTTPLDTLGALYQTLRAYAPTAFDPTFFMGEATFEPGSLFYPMVAVFRVTPLTLLGLLLLAWGVWRRRLTIARGPVSIWLLYALLFGTALSLSAAKFDRYLLPAMLPLHLAAAVGLVAVLWKVDLPPAPSLRRRLDNISSRSDPTAPVGYAIRRWLDGISSRSDPTAPVGYAIRRRLDGISSRSDPTAPVGYAIRRWLDNISSRSGEDPLLGKAQLGIVALPGKGGLDLPSLLRGGVSLTTTALFLLIALQSFFVLTYHPYYLAWYNPLAGGQAAAEHILPLGWGEGMEGAAQYLAAQPEADESLVASWGAVGLAPWYHGKLILPRPEKLWQVADYYVVYITDRQRREPIAEVMRAEKPVFVSRVRDLDYVWVYKRLKR